MDANALAKALNQGECALVATDTVYGLAALPGSAGYDKIFQLKERDRDQVLPWLVGGIDALEKYGASLSDSAVKLAQMFWPGALTLVVKASDLARETGACAADGTVALRMPDEPQLLELLEAVDGPLACTSANLHGMAAPASLEEVDASFLSLPKLDDIPVRCVGGQSSTVVDCTGAIPRILREGAINAKMAMCVACLDDRIIP